MAVTKKKTTRKASTKNAAKAKKGKGRRLKDNIKRTSKKLVDQVLVKMSPQLQEKIDHLIKTLEHSKRGPLGDLSFMAGKILIRAQEVSRSLQAEKKKAKGTAKK